MLSLLHRLHLIGRSLISVSGSNHNTVCLPHRGQSNRRRDVSTSFFSVLSCGVVFKIGSPYSYLRPKAKKKSLYHYRVQRLNGTGSKAQARVCDVSTNLSLVKVAHLSGESRQRVT